MDEPSGSALEKLTIGQLLQSLRPRQAWALLAVFFGVVSGAFGLGYRLQLSTAEVRAERMADKLAQFRGLQTKERFLALALRYLIARERAQAEPSAQNEEAAYQARDAYFAYVMELLERGEEARDEIDLRGIVLGKGGGQEVTVKFGYDGSVWPLPREFGLATKD